MFGWLTLISILVACGKKKPDPAQQIRAFMADWERAIDAKNPAVLDSLLTTAKNIPSIDPQKFLTEIYRSDGITRVNLVGRQLDIGEKQATVTGRLVRSGVPDSLATLSLTLLRTKRGWKLTAYRIAPFEPLRKDTANRETAL
ncbi:MAG: hypothetical protein L0Z48_06905 [candidate division Zixibacteria bacterium]|nr:hypothetical protein [candidate division Zixibacteria bacterium]MCI0596255.1 hypothetical protein [candidate division Zixibacteria bacterium]